MNIGTRAVDPATLEFIPNGTTAFLPMFATLLAALPRLAFTFEFENSPEIVCLLGTFPPKRLAPNSNPPRIIAVSPFFGAGGGRLPRPTRGGPYLSLLKVSPRRSRMWL